MNLFNRDALIASARKGHFGRVELSAAQVLILAGVDTPIPMLLWCPECGKRHIDEGEFATKPHHTHACQHCGHVWRPCVMTTVGVQFLPGYKNL